MFQGWGDMRRWTFILLALATAGALLWRLLAWRKQHERVQRHATGGNNDEQRPDEGSGPLVHRRYHIDIAHPTLTKEELMSRVQAQVEAFAPTMLAEFHKTNGQPRKMAVGDEYDVKIFGPWNGMVRVSDISPTSFELVTLEGHPEAGSIRFAVAPHPHHADAVRFSIESLARNRDTLVRLSYREGKIGQEAQRQTWVTFCQRVAEASGGEALGDVDVQTEELTRE
jgi:hypothetical protein